MATTGSTQSASTGMSSTFEARVNAELIGEARESGEMWSFLDVKQLQKGGLSLGFPQLTSTVSVSAITSGADELDAVVPTELTQSVATATAASKSAAVLQSWLSMFGSTVDWEKQVPAILGRAAADLMDVDASTLLGGGSNTVGTSGVDQVLGDLRSAALLLRRVAKGAARGAAFMLHPQQVDDVDAQLQQGTGPGLSSLMSRQDVINWYGAIPGSGLLEGFRGAIYGLPVFTSNNVPDANAAADHAGALFVPRLAFGAVVAWMPRIKVSEQDVNFRLATGSQVSMAYGVVEKVNYALVTLFGDHA